MAITDVMDSLEGSLYYCVDSDADENTVGATWQPLGYVTGFSFTRNKNKRAVYNKITKVCSKKGRQDYSGNISQLYVDWDSGVAKLFDDDVAVALKLVVDKDLTGNTDETVYLSIVDFDNCQFNAGNTNEGGDVTVSCDFTFANCHAV